LIKSAINLSLGLHKRRPSYRRSLQPLKREHPALFVGIFCPPGSGSGSTDPMETLVAGPGSSAFSTPGSRIRIRDDFSLENVKKINKNLLADWALPVALLAVKFQIGFQVETLFGRKKTRLKWTVSRDGFGF
jgi:hypothetical protein